MFGSSASVAERGICPGPRAVGYDPSAGMGGGYGHVSFRANLDRAGRRQHITTKNASAVEPARALVVLTTNETNTLEPKDP